MCVSILSAMAILMLIVSIILAVIFHDGNCLSIITTGIAIVGGLLLGTAVLLNSQHEAASNGAGFYDKNGGFYWCEPITEAPKPLKKDKK